MMKIPFKYICGAAVFLLCAAAGGAEAPRLDVAADPAELRAGGVTLVSATVNTPT